MFVELYCARSYVKCFISFFSFNPYKNPFKDSSILSSVQNWLRGFSSVTCRRVNSLSNS